MCVCVLYPNIGAVKHWTAKKEGGVGVGGTEEVGEGERRGHTHTHTHTQGGTEHSPLLIRHPETHIHHDMDKSDVNKWLIISITTAGKYNSTQCITTQCPVLSNRLSSPEKMELFSHCYNVEFASQCHNSFRIVCTVI